MHDDQSDGDAGFRRCQQMAQLGDRVYGIAVHLLQDVAAHDSGNVGWTSLKNSEDHDSFLRVRLIGLNR
jgi:hypothetical protein